MSSAPTSAEIARDARWLAQALDPRAELVRLVEMDREAYQAASFLDDRMFQPPVKAQLVPWATVAEAAQSIARSDARWIFHIGHVGSTLVSRLLGEIDSVLALREPRLLRDLALAPSSVRALYAGTMAKLMSRTFGVDDYACVKVTSFASEIAPELVPSGERALFIYARPRTYIASILAGENSLKELHLLAPSRAQRIADRLSGLPLPGRDAHLAAIGWACEMTSLENAAERMGDRLIAWTDFDQMLDDMPAALSRAAEHFGFACDQARLAAIATGPLMKRYSKALEFDYSASLRRSLIAEAERDHRSEIDDSLAMLRSASERSPLLARALERSGEL